MTRHLARVASDHYPIIFNMGIVSQPLSKIIRFEDILKSYLVAWIVVLKYWSKFYFGNHSEILRRTFKALYFWNKNKVKNLYVTKKELNKEIMEF